MVPLNADPYYSIFARGSRASPRPERVKARRSRHALRFNGLPSLALPGAHDRLLNISYSQGFGEARLSLLARFDGTQEVIGFDYLQVIIAQIQAPGRIEVTVIRVSRSAQKGR